MKDRERRLQNKLKNLEIDLNYRVKAYVAAYSVLAKMKDQMEHVPAVQELLNEWNKKDEALYQAWIKLSRETHREQRAEAKAARGAAESELVPVDASRVKSHRMQA